MHEGRLDPGSYASNQRSFIEGLAQKPDRSIIERVLPLAAPSSPNTSSIKPRQESVILVGWLTARSYISRSKN